MYYACMAKGKTTTIQLDTDRLVRFREAVKSQGFEWRFKLNEIIDACTRSHNQAGVKKMTRKKPGAI